MLLLVLGKRTCRANHTLRIGAGYVTLQERRISDFHLVNRQGVVERAEWNLKGTQRVSAVSHMGSTAHTSPQSMILMPCWYGSSPQDRDHAKSPWIRRLPTRMPVGPKRAPGRYVTEVSNGIPRIATSNAGDASSRQRKYGRCEKERGPVKSRSPWEPYFSLHDLDESLKTDCL